MRGLTSFLDEFLEGIIPFSYATISIVGVILAIALKRLDDYRKTRETLTSQNLDFQGSVSY